MPPQPVLPSYEGPCLTNLVGALLGAHDGSAAAADWLPAGIAGARQVVLLVLDGLGREQFDAHRSLMPTLAAGSVATVTSVAPSTTAAALTSLVTGVPPAVHGVVGYRVQVQGAVMNVLGWQLDGRDARRSVPAGRFQPYPAFPASPGPVPVVVRADYAGTGFTAAHLGTSEIHGWHTPSGAVVEVGRAVQAGSPFVYAYYDGIDRVAHACGLGSHYRAELESADRLVGLIRSQLPDDAVLVVTADHGEVDVGPSVEVLGPEVMHGVRLLSGEGRFRWLHVAAGAADDVAATAAELYGSSTWVRTREQIVEEGWLGGESTPDVADRLGDVALVPFEPTAFLDPADTGEQRLAARHGSLTAAEMLVPVVALPGGS